MLNSQFGQVSGRGLNLAQPVYGNLGGMSVEVSTSAVLRRPGFFAVVAVFIFLGLTFGTLGFFAHPPPYDLGSILAQLLLGALIGGLVGLAASAAMKFYSTFPRSVLGHILLDRVENYKLWFYGEDGKRHHIGLRRQVINVHDETTLHIGVLSRVLELKTQTPTDMEKLSSFLRNEAKIFRHYGDSETPGSG